MAGERRHEAKVRGRSPATQPHPAPGFHHRGLDARVRVLQAVHQRGVLGALQPVVRLALEALEAEGDVAQLLGHPGDDVAVVGGPGAGLLSGAGASLARVSGSSFTRGVYGWEAAGPPSKICACATCRRSAKNAAAKSAPWSAAWCSLAGRRSGRAR
jgi:hypothetical protein